MGHGSGYGRVLIREMNDVIGGDANANSLIVIIRSNVHMITVVAGSERAPGTCVSRR
jgi:hypothetical protein